MRRWYNDKGYDFFQRKYAYDFSKKRKEILSAESLSFQSGHTTKLQNGHDSSCSKSSLFRDYAQEYILREARNQEQKWKVILNFLLFLQNNLCFKTLFLRFSNETLTIYDHFFDYEPKKFISRANFKKCVNDLILNSQQDNNRYCTKQPKNRFLQEKLTLNGFDECMNDVCRAFDTHNQNKIDWRGFCYMMHIHHKATSSSEEFMCIGFRYFSVHKNVTLQATDKIYLKDVVSIIHPLLLHPMTIHKHVVDIFCDNLIQVRFENNEVQVIFEGKNEKLNTELITFKKYQYFLRQKQIQGLLRSKQGSVCLRSCKRVHHRLVNPFEEK